MTEIRFDFDGFSVAAIKIIDSIRSSGRSGSKTPVENRINAFYRALGLPAIVTGKKPSQDSVKENNGNVFLEEDLELEIGEKQKLRNRKNSYLAEVTDEEKNTFLDFNKSKVTDSTETRKRGTLFPMVVDGDIEIWPKDRRVEQAFLAENLAFPASAERKNKPLIETIISIRLKTDEQTDSEKQNNVSLIINKELKIIGNEIIEILNDLKGYIGVVAQKTISDVGKARKHTGQNPSPKRDNIAEEKPSSDTIQGKSGELDKRLEKLQNELNFKNVRLAIFDFDDTFGEGVSISKNFRAPIMSNLLVDLAINTSETSVEQKSINETKKQLAKKTKQIKQSHKKADFLFGTFSGISSTDILAVIVALFKVDIDILISLLNKDNLNNLKKEKYGGGTPNQSKTAKDAVLKLQEKVTEVLNEIDAEIQKTIPESHTSIKDRAKAKNNESK